MNTLDAAAKQKVQTQWIIRERRPPSQQQHFVIMIQQGFTSRLRYCRTFWKVFGIAEDRDISWADVEPLTDEEAYRLFYPDRGVRESVFEDPDWGYVHKKTAKVGMNLRLLHDEYRGRCRREGKVAMGYTKFYGDYGALCLVKLRLRFSSRQFSYSSPKIFRVSSRTRKKSMLKTESRA